MRNKHEFYLLVQEGVSLHFVAKWCDRVWDTENRAYLHLNNPQETSIMAKSNKVKSIKKELKNRKNKVSKQKAKIKKLQKALKKAA